MSASGIFSALLMESFIADSAICTVSSKGGKQYLSLPSLGEGSIELFRPIVPELKNGQSAELTARTILEALQKKAR